jgi:molybdopterin converting factor small subunit
MPRVIVPPPYQGPTQGQAHVEVDASTLRGCIEAVESQFPGFGPLVFDGAGRLQRFVKLFVNGDLVDPEDVDRPVASGDEIEVLAAIAGG